MRECCYTQKLIRNRIHIWKDLVVFQLLLLALLLLIRSTEPIEAIELTSRIHASYFTADKYANEHSARAARLAAGLCADLASAIFLDVPRMVLLWFVLLVIMLV